MTSTPEQFLSSTALDVPYPLAFEILYVQSKAQRRSKIFVRKMVAPGAAATCSRPSPS